MLKGKNVWNEWYQKGMGEMRIGERSVYSFPDMKKSFYDMLRASAENILIKQACATTGTAAIPTGNF